MHNFLKKFHRQQPLEFMSRIQNALPLKKDEEKKEKKIK